VSLKEAFAGLKGIRKRARPLPKGMTIKNRSKRAVGEPAAAAKAAVEVVHQR
jgi:hypothetical protein